jgi:hypothetical protein
MTELGHEERFPSPRLSARFAFNKETLAGMGVDGEDAPVAAVCLTTIGRLKSTLSGRSS